MRNLPDSLLFQAFEVFCSLDHLQDDSLLVVAELRRSLEGKPVLSVHGPAGTHSLTSTNTGPCIEHLN